MGLEGRLRDVWIYLAGAVPLPIQIWLSILLKRAPDFPLGTACLRLPNILSSPSPARRDRMFRVVRGMEDPLGQQWRITKLMDGREKNPFLFLNPVFTTHGSLVLPSPGREAITQPDSQSLGPGLRWS